MLFRGVSGRYQRDKMMTDYEVIPDAEIVGWRGQCTCGWQGELPERITSPAAPDFQQRRDYLPPEDSAHASLKVEEAISRQSAYERWADPMNPDDISEQTCNATKAKFTLPEALIAHGVPAPVRAEDLNQQPHGGYGMHDSSIFVFNLVYAGTLGRAPDVPRSARGLYRSARHHCRNRVPRSHSWSPRPSRREVTTSPATPRSPFRSSVTAA